MPASNHRPPAPAAFGLWPSDFGLFFTPACRSNSSRNSHHSRFGSLDHSNTQKPPSWKFGPERHSWSIPPNQRRCFRNSSQNAVSSHVKSSRSGAHSPVTSCSFRREAQTDRHCFSPSHNSTQARTKPRPSIASAKCAQPPSAAVLQNGQFFGFIIVLPVSSCRLDLCRNRGKTPAQLNRSQPSKEMNSEDGKTGRRKGPDHL